MKPTARIMIRPVAVAGQPNRDQSSVAGPAAHVLAHMLYSTKPHTEIFSDVNHAGTSHLRAIPLILHADSLTLPTQSVGAVRAALQSQQAEEPDMCLLRDRLIEGTLRSGTLEGFSIRRQSLNMCSSGIVSAQSGFGITLSRPDRAAVITIGDGRAASYSRSGLARGSPGREGAVRSAAA
jgi:hypothetical protein